jgi:hypothetical protein
VPIEPAPSAEIERMASDAVVMPALQVFRRQHGDRRRRLGVGAAEQRAGDDNFLNLRLVGRRRSVGAQERPRRPVEEASRRSRMAYSSSISAALRKQQLRANEHCRRDADHDQPAPVRT